MHWRYEIINDIFKNIKIFGRDSWQPFTLIRTLRSKINLCSFWNDNRYLRVSLSKMDRHLQSINSRIDFCKGYLRSMKKGSVIHVHAYEHLRNRCYRYVCCWSLTTNITVTDVHRRINIQTKILLSIKLGRSNKRFFHRKKRKASSVINTNFVFSWFVPCFVVL